MTCDTLVRTDQDGRNYYKPKKAYDTLELAIAEAKRRNASESQLTKLVAYKCTYCFKYHIGRNGKDLTKKEKEKIKKDLNIGLKVVGKINLDTLKPNLPIKVVGWIDLNKIRY